MNESISAFMDGEASDAEGERALNLLKVNADARQGWVAYHMIGDALRQAPVGSADVTARVAKRIATEPTVLAPRLRKRVETRPLVVWSAAASVTAVALAGWLMLSANFDRVVPTLAQPASPVSQLADYVTPNVTPYLAAHQEFSKSSTLQSMTLRVSSPIQQDSMR